jgi:uncharacterized protein YrrD
MLRSVKDLQGFSIRATDGDIGRVHDVYFEARSSRVRYIVVEAGPWLIGKKVLVSPVALGKPDWDSQALPANLTKEQVKDCPDWDADRPMTRQDERVYHDYFHWPYYWGPGGAGYAGTSGFFVAAPEALLWGQQGRVDTPDDGREETTGGLTDNNLRSARDIAGYKVEAEGGEIGDVHDFLFEDEGWNIRYIVVDTGGWLPGKKVLVSPEWVTTVDWRDSHIHVDVHRDAIESAPEYNTDVALDRSYEQRLYAHYGRQPSWAVRAGKER